MRVHWKIPKIQDETVVRCCNCKSEIAIAEARVAGPKLNAIFSCSPRCEQEYEDSEHGKWFISTWGNQDKTLFK